MIKQSLKKISAALLAAIILAATPVSAFAATLGLSPASGTYGKGCTFQLKIELDTLGAQTDGTDAILLFDPAKITPSQSAIQNGTIYPDYPANVVDAANGKISITGLANVSQSFSGKGTLATVSFQVNSDAAPGPFVVQFDFDPNDVSKTTDTNVVERGTVAELLSSVTNGSYTVGTGSSCSGTSSSTTGAGSTTSGAGRTGFIPYVGGPTATGSSVNTTVPYNASDLPPSGSQTQTIVFSVVGGIFVLLGIIGLALL